MRPIKIRKWDDAVARKIHPRKRGTIAIMSAGLRPQRSMMGPEANEPTGAARLCTLAEINRKKKVAGIRLVLITISAECYCVS